MAPAFGVEIAIIQDQQILLTQRADLPVWCLPGGAVGAHESLAQAAIRETVEETGEFVLADVVEQLCRMPTAGQERLDI